MDVNSVPQDDSSTYAKNKKAIYAKDEDGSVKVVKSSGWSAEETVTKQALEELLENEAKAYCEVKKGLKSPLYYYMYSIRMDLQVLSESTSFFKWTIKRDFKPEVFAKISEKRLAIYVEAMGISSERLKVLQERDYECS
ncbi:MAG: hypothetical protein M0Q24_08015 [Sulfurimonas sp.]|uniref:hypothetical protein n=1 Tax=Sulfurimonas sp. TaxID=2022749 RepID=UPI0025EBE62D|nr:hypothetical protein [Sulfurimonas sp.]MCK9492021.1 hypothetical protein [Sulfurimonas sp.]